MTNRLEGKVALISGAARGQGAAEARLFAAEGASVVITDVRDDALVSLEKELLDSGATVSATRLDVADEADWDRAVQHATAVFGELNVLVNNAGILDMAGVEQTSLEVWNRIVAVNQTGVWLGMKSAIPSMRRA
ncbi:SDR family NAD(P)-dependent oxidoreductase, partial [Mycolicibacterium litorale]|uniref:SDR family NAD(P)-dependent oxidoreductase n=1 Tax=Mycolicibacterium litorale TaxID=758802 RepID=UPI0039A0FEB1